jgi:hypothetical protein
VKVSELGFRFRAFFGLQENRIKGLHISTWPQSLYYIVLTLLMEPILAIAVSVLLKEQLQAASVVHKAKVAFPNPTRDTSPKPPMLANRIPVTIPVS